MPGRTVTVLAVNEGELLPAVERAAQLGTYVWEREGAVVWSRGMLKLLGFDPDAPPATLAFFDRVHEADRAAVQDAFVRMTRDGDIPPIVYRVVLPSGEVRHLRGQGIGVRDADGVLQRAVGTVIDVTEQARVAGALESTLALLADTQRWAGVGSFVYHPSTDTMEWSEELCSILGLPPGTAASSEVVGRLIHEDDRPRRDDWLRRVAAGEVLPPLFVRVRREDGTVRHIESRAHLTSGPEGPRIVGVGIDVTARVELEEQLRHAAKMEAIGSLAAGVAHDFNNYLTAIGLQLSQVQRRGIDSPSALAPAREALDRCAQLTRQLLAFARRQPTAYRPLDVGSLVRRTVDLFAGLAGDLRLEVSTPAEPVYVDGDEGQLEAALLNLLVNAKDATPSGGLIAVRIDVVTHGDGATGPTEWARVRVEDSGGGIAPEHVHRIFEPYFTTKELGRGTGLGLASVLGTVQQHGGAVTVSSEPGRGACFEVRIPVRDIPSTRLSAVPASVRSVLPAGAVLLVVEDMEPLRRVTAAALRAAGATVYEAADGREALVVLAAQSDVELVLTDVRMPHMSGDELARVVLGGPSAPAVVFMTGYADVVPPEGRKIPTLQKPMTEEDIVRVVGREIDARRARRVP